MTEANDVALQALSDGELVLRIARTSDGLCLTELARRHQEAVVSVAMGMMHDYSDAQDVAQLSFMKVLVNASSWNGGNVRAWVIAIARNCCLDLLRKRRTTIPIESEMFAAAGSDGSERIDVENVLQQLSRPQRICLWHVYFAGRSAEEICRETGYTPKAVRSHIENGRKRFKRLWDRRNDGGPNRER